MEPSRQDLIDALHALCNAVDRLPAPLILIGLVALPDVNRIRWAREMAGQVLQRCGLEGLESPIRREPCPKR